MYTSHYADGSKAYSFEVEFVGLLFKDWIFAASKLLKDPAASLATVELDILVGAIANQIKRSTVRTLHR